MWYNEQNQVCLLTLIRFTQSLGREREIHLETINDERMLHFMGVHILVLHVTVKCYHHALCLKLEPVSGAGRFVILQIDCTSCRTWR